MPQRVVLEVSDNESNMTEACSCGRCATCRQRKYADQRREKNIYRSGRGGATPPPPIIRKRERYQELLAWTDHHQDELDDMNLKFADLDALNISCERSESFNSVTELALLE